MGKVAKLFPKLLFDVATNAKKKVLTSMLIDVYISNWFTTPVFVFLNCMMSTNGDFAGSVEGLKNKLWPMLSA